MSAELTLRIVLILVVSGAGAILCGGRAIQSWRLYRTSRRRPLLHAISAEELLTINDQWPNRQWRWPPPVPPMVSADSVVAATYGQLARRTERKLRRVAEVLSIIAGAWLGLTLPQIWRQVLQGQASTIIDLYVDPDFWTAFAPVFVIAVSVALVNTAEDNYARMHAAYRRAAIQLPPVSSSSAEYTKVFSSGAAVSRWRRTVAEWLVGERS